MAKIFQEFNLGIELMIKESLNDFVVRAKLGLPSFLVATESLKRQLAERGYVVLTSNKYWNGVPESIIIGADFGKDHKVDFQTFAGNLGLRFKSGDSYDKY